MKLWCFDDPTARRGQVEYAEFFSLGTWDSSGSNRMRPLIIEWAPGSDVVGDFIWSTLGFETVIQDRVAKVLQDAHVPDFELGPAQMPEPSKAAKRHRAKEPRVQLPYSGPKLWDLWATAWTNADYMRTTYKKVKHEDWSVDFLVTGVQRSISSWSRKRMTYVSKGMRPRIEGKGLFVPNIQGVFRAKEYPDMIYCTDDVKRLIEKHGFTNVSFLETGDVLPPER